MEAIFLKILNMSITASWLVLAIIILRLILKKAPKAISVFMWALVGVRLICPFSFESILSLIPSAETVPQDIIYSEAPAIHSGVPIFNSTVNPIISENLAPEVGASVNPMQIVAFVASVVWIVGIVAMVLYTVVSYFRIHRKVREAVPYQDNIWLCDHIDTPFILGVVRPRIYLPSNMNEQDIEYVIAHEMAHLKRHDHWWKPLGFLLLTVYWFNPILWIAYVLLCKDIELACDEKVIKDMGTEIKKPYSEALINCSVPRKMISACPLAFGEVGVKGRVKSVLNYKKPAFWIIVVAVVASIVVAVCFLTNPRTTIDDELSVFLDMQIAEHHYSEGHTDDNFITVHHKVLDVDKGLTRTTVYMWVLYHEYSCENGEIKLEAGAHTPTVITAKRTGSHGHYELVEYWTPRDGSYYADDIKEKFPWHLHSKALDSQRYIGEQKAFCENAAKEYFNAKIENGNLNITTVNLSQLRDTHPHFFNVPTDGGLTVYIWEMGENIYECHLANTAREALTDQSFVYTVGAATIPEMRAILTTYNVDKKDITVQPVINPLSSYYYEIDDTYRANIKELFWKDSYNVIDYDGSSIPKLNVTCGNASTEASMGTTEWTSDAGNGKMQTVNGDSSHPLERMDYLLPLALKVNRSDNATPIVGLNFNVAPDSIKVNSWFVGDNGNTKSFDAEVDGFNIKLNAGKETCVYEVVATWNKSSKYYGTVRYSFCVVESEEANVQTSSTYDEWGLKMDILFKSATEFDAVFNHNSSKMTVKGSLTTDPEFEIKAIHNGKVITFGEYMRNVLHYDYADPEFAWDTVLYTIAQNKETSIDQYLLGTYGNLPVGQYLLCKNVTLTTEAGSRKTKVYTVEFAVTD